MISFDDMGGTSGGTVDLQPVYNSLSYLLNCCSSVSSEISNLDNNTLSIWNYVSTMTGGGGGGGEALFKTLNIGFNQNAVHWFVNSIASNVPNSGWFQGKFATVQNALNGTVDAGNITFSDLISWNNVLNSKSPGEITMFLNGSEFSDCFNECSANKITFSNGKINFHNCFNRYASNKFVYDYLEISSCFNNAYNTISYNVFDLAYKSQTNDKTFTVSNFNVIANKVSVASLLSNQSNGYITARCFDNDLLHCAEKASAISFNNTLFYNSVVYCVNSCSNVYAWQHGFYNSVNAHQQKNTTLKAINSFFFNYNGSMLNSNSNGIVKHNAFVNSMFAFFNANTFTSKTDSTSEADAFIKYGGIINGNSIFNSNSINEFGLLMPCFYGLSNFAFKDNTINNKYTFFMNNKIVFTISTNTSIVSIYNDEMELNLHPTNYGMYLPTLFNDHRTKPNHSAKIENIIPDIDIVKHLKLKDGYHDINQLNKATISELSINGVEIGKRINAYYQLPISHYDAYHVNSLTPIMKEATFGYFRDNGLPNYYSNAPNLSWAVLSNSGGDINQTDWKYYALGLNGTNFLYNQKQLKRLDVFYKPATRGNNITIGNIACEGIETLNFNFDFGSLNLDDTYFVIGSRFLSNCPARGFNIQAINGGNRTGISKFESNAFVNCYHLKDIILPYSVEQNAFNSCRVENFYLPIDFVNNMTNPQIFNYPIYTNCTVNKINMYILGANSDDTLAQTDNTKFANFMGTIYTRLNIINLYP